MRPELARGPEAARLGHNPLGSADSVNPNFDVAYLETWFAVEDATAVLLEVPEVKDRNYTAQILGEWGEVIVNVNERAAAVKPYGRFALAKPGSSLLLPEGPPASTCTPRRPR